MRAKTEVCRLRKAVAAHGPTRAERRRRTVDERWNVLNAFCTAIDASRPVPPALGTAATTVIHAFTEPLLVDGWVPEEGSHPLAEFAAGLLRPGAVLPRPFPLPLLAALCDPTTDRVSSSGCRRCEVLLPERVVCGRHPVYGPFEPVLTPCPVCGSKDLGWIHRQGTGLRFFETRLPREARAGENSR